eukprot:3941631-Rhodomonas_salina.5
MLLSPLCVPPLAAYAPAMRSPAQREIKRNSAPPRCHLYCPRRFNALISRGTVLTAARWPTSRLYGETGWTSTWTTTPSASPSALPAEIKGDAAHSWYKVCRNGFDFGSTEMGLISQPKANPFSVQFVPHRRVLVFDSVQPAPYVPRPPEKLRRVLKIFRGWGGNLAGDSRGPIVLRLRGPPSPPPQYFRPTRVLWYAAYFSMWLRYTVQAQGYHHGIGILQQHIPKDIYIHLYTSGTEIGKSHYQDGAGRPPSE